MDSERRLNEHEVSAVLRRAAEESAQPGLTVAQVQEIAKDVGLSPEAVQRALTESASGALRPATRGQRFGLPVSVAKDVSLPGPLSDDAWEVLVSSLQATFGARGKVSRSGAVREWRNGKLRIAIESAAGEHRLRMSTQKDGALQGPLLGSTTSLLMASFFAAGATVKPGFALLAAVPTAFAIGMVAWPFFNLPKWARTRAAQFDDVAREAAALASPPRAGRTPLAALADQPPG